MGAAATCTELWCAGVDDALAPAIHPPVAPQRSRNKSLPSAAGASRVPNIDALWQEFRRHAPLDGRHKQPSFACTVTAARLAEGLWRLGSVAEAASTFGEANMRCEDLVANQPGPRAELLLAEVSLSRALALKESGQPATESLELLHRALDLAKK